MPHLRQAISREEFLGYIAEAAKSAGYAEGFGVEKCDLSKPVWWACYSRQSLEEQTQNNRLPDYLRTCAREAKKLGVVVPLEYVLYDARTGEHLERPNMIELRQFVAGRRIAGVIFPALDRLSREPLHQQVFEVEAAYYRVRLHYADAPNGTDPGSQFARSILAHAAKLVKLSNRKNAVGGNIGRVVKGLAPAHRAAYGYRYRREGDIGSDGRLHVKRAWWEIDGIGPDGQPASGSPAWVVVQIFTWIGSEGRTLHWVANTLNEMDIQTSEGRKWSPGKVARIVHRQCYSGTHTYNQNARVPNPDKPMGDITGEIKRTMTRPKPEEEQVHYQVPALVDGELRRKAIASITDRGRGRGKQGKQIRALLRSRIICPRCGKPMVVRRDGRDKRVYYHCSKYFQPWRDSRCDYRKFIPGSWDDLVWGDICQWLRNDDWVEKQLASSQSQDDSVERLIRLQQFKVSHAQSKIAKIREGFEAGIYDVGEARRRIAAHEAALSKAESEVARLRARLGAGSSDMVQLEILREDLNALRDRNLDEASFAEKIEIVSKLGITVHPAEDLKAMRILCQVNLRGGEPGGHRPDAAQASTETQELKQETSIVPKASPGSGGRASEIECGKVQLVPPNGCRSVAGVYTDHLPGGHRDALRVIPNRNPYHSAIGPAPHDRASTQEGCRTLAKLLK